VKEWFEYFYVSDTQISLEETEQNLAANGKGEDCFG